MTGDALKTCKASSGERDGNPEKQICHQYKNRGVFAWDCLEPCPSPSCNHSEKERILATGDLNVPTPREGPKKLAEAKCN
jgi:hypothetical protein